MADNGELRTKSYKLALTGLGLLLLSSVFPAATPAASDNGAKPIKIGFIASLSGVGADPSKDMVQGISLFMDECKKKIAGHPVELIIGNDESSPATATVVARKMVEDDKVDVLDGLLLANIGYQVAHILPQLKTPMVYAVSAADDLTQRKPCPWMVRASYTSSQASMPFGDWVYNKLHYKRVVTVGMDYPFGYEVVGGFQKGFEEAGGKVVQKLWAPLGFRDFEQILRQIKPDADAVFFCTTSAAAEIIPVQYKKLGIKLPVIGFGTSYDEAILPHLGDAAIGATTAMMYSAALPSADNQHFVQLYRAKYHCDPSSYAECAWTSGMVIRKAIESLHGDVSDKQKLLAALKQADIKDAPRGPMHIDSYGNPVENIYVRRVDKVDGKLQNTVIATFKDVSQFWHYQSDPAAYLKQPAYTRDYPPCKNCETSH